MNVLLLLLLLPQQLTWYEVYERGEKAFSKSEYAITLADMDGALAKKPEPARNQFTRAVQKIDYKPYYYKALALYRMDRLPEAFEAAQRSFNGEVVAGSPDLQADLAPIFSAYRSWALDEYERVKEARAEMERRAEELNEKTRLIGLLGQGRLDEVEAALVDKGEEFDAIRANLARQRSVLAGLDSARNETLQQIEAWIGEGEWNKAKALYAFSKGKLDVADRDRLEQQLARAPEETAPPKEDPNAKAASAEVEAFKKRLANLEGQKKELSGLLDQMRDENRDLAQRLKTEGDQPALTIKPQLLLRVSRGEGREILIDGRALLPLLPKSWRLRLDGQALELPADKLSGEGGVYRLEHQLTLAKYGKHHLDFDLTDELGASVTVRETVVLPRPWFLNPRLWAVAAVLVLVLIAALVAWRRHVRRRAKLRHYNPYIAGSPVRQAEMFYGRDDLLHRIIGLVHKNSFMIHGERRIGKTSMLMQLKAELSAMQSNDYRFFPVFIDLQGVLEEELFHHMMAEVVHEAESWPIQTDDLTWAEDQSNYRGRQFARDMKAVIGKLKETTSHHAMVVLLMDEVDVLNEFGEKTNQKLRGIFMKEFAEHLTCVMAGIHLKKEWDSSGSPWYNFFEEIPVKPIDEKDARALIVDPVSGIFTYKRAAVDLIIERTGNHPYLIQKVCVALIGRKLKDHRFTISEDDVRDALEVLDNPGAGGEGSA